MKIGSRKFNRGVVVWFLGILVLAGFTGCGKEAEQAAAPPAPEVEVAEAIQKDVPIYMEWIGTADGYVNATIRAQVAGYLIRQNYTDGDFVKKGTLLFEIDPRTFQAAVEMAKAELAQAEARHATATANLARIRPLAEQNAVSKKDLDDAVGIEQSTRASVLAAKAALDKAKLELGFTKITSPIDGIAGIATAQIGNLVGPGQKEELSTVSTVDPIKIYIHLSEQQYLKSSGALEERQARARQIPLQLILADGSVYPYPGAFSIADRQVDLTTGTIRIAALFSNPGNVLRPGQYGKVKAEIAVKKDALLVPQRALTEMQGRYLVGVVGEDNKVTIRPVKAGEQVGSLRIVEEGVKPGQRVVAEGIQKVKEGMTVSPKSFAEGSETAAPSPEEPAGNTEAAEAERS
ncbi:MAG: efflux RND transporter periplasmic adaptor subunit [bacterium]